MEHVRESKRELMEVEMLAKFGDEGGEAVVKEGVFDDHSVEDVVQSGKERALETEHWRCQLWRLGTSAISIG